ncbi:MAG: pyruvate, phosphate dikinase [Chloroflexi bacterium]|nr:pyruvate, phosphate dikinase [Chloroflexota bacterium]
MAHKWVYLFSEGNKDMRNLLGGKGAGVAEMTNAGLPVPPGFTITTEACNAYYDAGKQFPAGMWKQTLAALKKVEEQTGKKFGDPANPLLVSVRSGAKFSMPGMMDTVLNLGLNAQTLPGLARLTGDERFAYDAYRRLIQMFGRIVMGIDGAKFEAILDAYKERTEGKKDTDLTTDMLKAIVAEYKALYKAEIGSDFPEDPYEQLRLAIGAVFGSWFGKRAVDYRNFNKIPHDLGTAANVQTMVFGNMGFNSGTGVAFTRDPATGKKELYGEYLLNAQGEDVVAGIRTPRKIAEMQTELPAIYTQFRQIAERLERHYRDVQDLEFTIEKGKLWMLQTRAGKRTAAAAVKIAVDMVKEGLISKEEAVLRVEPPHVIQLLLPRFDEAAKAKARQAGALLASGLNASPGAATGQAIFDPDTAETMGKAKEPVILVRTETSPDDVHGMLHAKGILTQRGGATSHAAVVARGLGLPCVAGCEALRIDEEAKLFSVNSQVIKEGDFISIDGTTGEVFSGQIATIEPNFAEEHDLITLLSWADEIRQREVRHGPEGYPRQGLQVWANADYPRDAQRARDFGAQGIGLCRTEHMFFEQDRLPTVQKMILSASEAQACYAKIKRAEDELKRQPDDPKLIQAVQEAKKEAENNTAVQTYEGALASLLPIQRGDFVGILRTMHGLPVIIRLIDPPLHEFLPSYEELLVEVTELKCKGGDPAELAEKEALLKEVAAMREANPMLGLRGCRLGITMPQITQMQVRAILEAACLLTKEGVEVHPEIMIPLVGHVNELKNQREALETVARQVMAEQGVNVDYKFGTMIEIPRAALTADQIAEYAQFFSFGTNDLTQTVFGISRDDAEGKFLLWYVEQKLLPDNPFQVLDREGVGQLMRTCVEKGRKTRSNLEIGICGEHGGEPSSIEFCHMAGLNYVSCSPFRVPVARLAAAQAALTKAEKDK